MALSLFPGIGLLDLAFEEAGYCVVRGPDLLWGGDIRKFHPPAGRFDGVIGGPPCQEHTALAHLNRAQGVSSKHGDQNPEFARVVMEAQPAWFLRENAPGADLAWVDGYATHTQLVEDHWCGGETIRKRRICFGTRDGRKLRIEPVFPKLHPARAVTGDARILSVGERVRSKDGRRYGGALPKTGKTLALSQMLRLQGFPEDFFGPDSPFKESAKRQMIGNGVPRAMGRAIAAAVRAQAEREAA